MVDTGHRRYPIVCHDSDEEEHQVSVLTDAVQPIYKADNSLRVWQYKAEWNEVAHTEVLQ